MDEILSGRPQFTKEKDHTPSARRQVKLLDFSGSKRLIVKPLLEDLEQWVIILHRICNHFTKKHKSYNEKQETLLKINYRPQNS